MKNEYILILDFGGQYNQLIARRVRECNVYCEVKPYTLAIDEIKKLSPKGIIFTGGPNSVYDEKSPHISKEIFELGVPVLGSLLRMSDNGLYARRNGNFSKFKERIWKNRNFFR